MKRILFIVLAALLIASCSIVKGSKGNSALGGVKVQTTFLGCTYGDTYDKVESILFNGGLYSRDKAKTIMVFRYVKFAGFDWESASFHFDAKKELMGVTFKSTRMNDYPAVLRNLTLKYGQDNIKTMDDGTLCVADRKMHAVSLSNKEKEFSLVYSDWNRLLDDNQSHINEL